MDLPREQNIIVTPSFDAEELEEIRSEIVEFWAAARVPRCEIAARLGIETDALVDRFACELLRAQIWTADAVVRIYDRARGGNENAATLWLFATCFDKPDVAKLLSLQIIVN